VADPEIGQAPACPYEDVSRVADPGLGQAPACPYLLSCRRLFTREL